MSVNDPTPAPPADAGEQARHDLVTSLMTITGRTQLLQRQVQRSRTLTDRERTTMLAGLATTLTTARLLADDLLSE